MTDELVTVAKSLQLKNGFHPIHGGRMIAVQLEEQSKWMFLPDELNKDFEDDYYHGYIAGDYVSG